jgi:hypothetical protein
MRRKGVMGVQLTGFDFVDLSPDFSLHFDERIVQVRGVSALGTGEHAEHTAVAFSLDVVEKRDALAELCLEHPWIIVFCTAAGAHGWVAGDRARDVARWRTPAVACHVYGLVQMMRA